MRRRTMPELPEVETVRKGLENLVKGKTIKEVARIEPGYYGWMLDANFPLYTKQVLRKEMEVIKSENEAFKVKKKEDEEKSAE